MWAAEQGGRPVRVGDTGTTAGSDTCEAERVLAPHTADVKINSAIFYNGMRERPTALDHTCESEWHAVGVVIVAGAVSVAVVVTHTVGAGAILARQRTRGSP